MSKRTPAYEISRKADRQGTANLLAMGTFAERYGYTAVRSVVQYESMDNALRNALWDAIRMTVFLDVEESKFYLRRSTEPRVAIANALWNGFFKAPMDTIPARWPETEMELRKYFMECAWFQAYSFLEFLVKNVNTQMSTALRTQAQGYMRREMAAYRFVANEIVAITDDEEIASIENALKSPSRPIQTHLRSALAHLSDRSNPDYRNSVKESISAVEAAVRALAGSDNGTLGQVLKNLNPPLPPAFSKALSMLYGYTSDSGGIRHALSDESTVDVAEARFMLIACSAFINLLRERGRNALN